MAYPPPDLVPTRSLSVYSVKMLIRITLAVAASCARAAEPAAPPADLVALGKYRVTTSGCHDCHTPMKMTPQGPKPDMDRALSGHPEALVMPEAPTLPP